MPLLFLKGDPDDGMNASLHFNGRSIIMVQRLFHIRFLLIFFGSLIYKTRIISSWASSFNGDCHRRCYATVMDDTAAMISYVT